MPASLLSALRLLIAGTAFVVNTIAHTVPLLVAAMFKLLLPVKAWRLALGRLLVALAERWIAVNSILIARLTPTRIVVRGDGVDAVAPNTSYLVLCNHQSWVDIPVLQHVLNRRAPLLRFFLKRQLIWVPLLGLAWWALDFPFMRRHSREAIARKPELALADVEATRRACRRFRDTPVAVMNFVEGTRFTVAKQQAQASPYRHLLRPKAGGVAQVFSAMGDLLSGVLDVTIIYPQGSPSVIDLFAGRVQTIEVDLRLRAIPSWLSDGDEDAQTNDALRDWLNSLWGEKDMLIDRRLTGDANASN
ncbi:MAG: acyltransferase [Gammaproteobacteria bacterium HGW-Gammaproteobacteria-4]|jgi:1-acyl-sn-glycerol-3-phosphate acyltransferase|nr:MAG: acyltransferase [Gammaproteobacteria bacterium HGW-Gammaproteobacteria-4]